MLSLWYGCIVLLQRAIKSAILSIVAGIEVSRKISWLDSEEV